MRYILYAFVVLGILCVPTAANAARHDRPSHREARSFSIEKPKRPLPPRKRKHHHVKGDFWDVFPIPGLIPALNFIIRG